MSLTSTMVQLAHWLQPKETVISHFTILQFLLAGRYIFSYVVSFLALHQLNATFWSTIKTIQQWVPKVWTSETFIWGKHLTRVFGHPQTLICYWKVENQQLGNPTSNFDIQRFLMIFPWKSLEDIYIYSYIYKVIFKFLPGSCDSPRLIMQHPSTYANHRYWNTIIWVFP